MNLHPTRRIARTALQTAGIAAMVVAAAVAGSIWLLPRFTDVQTLTVLTGSMHPGIPRGAVVYVRPVAPDRIEVGDVITFLSESGSGATITHRVTSTALGADGRVFRTKGDNNPADDPTPVEEARVVGRVVFDLPAVGHLSRYAATPRGRLVAVVGPIALFGGYNLLTLVRELRAARQRKTHRPSGAAVGPPASEPGPDGRLLFLWDAGAASTARCAQLALVVVRPTPGAGVRVARLIDEVSGRIVAADDARVMVELAGDPQTVEQAITALRALGPTSVSRSSTVRASLQDPADSGLFLLPGTGAR